jgi:hypothetical protein
MIAQRNPDHASVDRAILETATAATGVDFMRE